MTLRQKLLVAQLPLIVALISVGYLSLHTTRSLATRSQDILKDNYRSVLAAQRMKESLERIDSSAVFIALGEGEKGDRQQAENIPRFEQELQVQEHNITEPGEAEATTLLRALWNRYRVDVERLRQGDAPSAMKASYFATLEPEFVKVKQAADVVLSINQDAMVRKSDATRRSSERAATILVLATLLALGLGGLASSAFTTRLLRPLSVLTQAARRIGEGDLEARAKVEGRDEVATLAGEFNEMADHLKQYRASSLGDLLQAQGAAQSAIDSLPDAVIIFGAQGGILSANELAEKDLQLELESGKESLARVDPALRALLERLRAQVLGGKGAYQPKGFDEAVRVVTSEGERFFLGRATPVHTAEGALTGATVVLQDVTRLHRFDELKNDVVATVAHEFRTPLTSLRMAIHLCLEGAAGPLTDKQLDLLQASRQDCERLQSIVDDLLDLSRLQAGGVPLDLRLEPLSELLERALDQSRALADARGVRLESQLPPPGLAVRVDTDRLALVFGNLLSNAIRFSPPGSPVELRSRMAEGMVRFEVVDAGPGIPPQFRQRIFDKYFQVPGAPGGSAGLGLYIAREVVQAHGGTIGVDSEVGKGSTVWFTIPSTDGPGGLGARAPA